ncbi:carbohydrate-binding module family 21 protein [Zasmidium cellare ATCC 36951]|uniref:Carbohydrate-binding module family 21 protein n=1 Tax=Zasmidium cellare ATCC 36951 TaxID=1080233 RepID=A0A6A6CFJ9_ZASCE|nr:carbohydrate-binding module family 21 protein [Zasmidium cellare ATCC 36951]KAF2164702.1 carbohydrate-binding module family 21 protein [Zasmidium cellare ATCC 36951]
MPYTPPSQQSPASSKSNSPVISRSSSYHQDDIPRSPVSSRPQPPRSHSSASYLHKHRRSPSITKSDAAPPTPTDAADSNVDAHDFASLRQSPPPVNQLRIPTGAVISPPDSSENSDGDETNAERGRELEKNWDQLQQAVRALPQQREGSPDKVGTELAQQGTASEPVSQVSSPTALTKEARKIAHSRSSTETKIIMKAAFADSPTQTSDDSDEDENPMNKPALVRKKSGELVKPALRPSSRRRYSSMPGTPTYSKSVHFNDSDNQTRHFLQVDKPIAVSAGSSPVETYDSESEFPFEETKKSELDIRVGNFPEDTFERKAKPVRVERIFLSSDKSTLVGVCAVRNISFQKLVVVRFTLDYWKTTSEVMAEYNNDPRSPPKDGCDRFIFHIKLTDQANIDSKTMLLCIRYNVGGTEYWDNNNDRNYQIDFKRTEQKVRTNKPIQSSPLGQRPLNAIPRSKHTGPRGRPESVDDDFVSRLDTTAAYHFGSPDKFLGDPQSSIKLKTKSKRPAMFATGPPTAPTNGLGSRYDFGNSLSAALSTAQDKLGRQSGLMNAAIAAKPQANGSYFGPVDRTEPAKVDAKTERPDAITTDRPAMGSEQYKDLVQKFCYFTPGSGKGVTSPLNAPRSAPATEKPPTTDGADDIPSTSTSASSSGSNSPEDKFDGANERMSHSPALEPFKSRSQSPVPMTGQGLGARSASPVSFGYPYHSHRDGYLSDTPTPTAIHG